MSGRPLLADRVPRASMISTPKAVLGRCAQWATRHLGHIREWEVARLRGSKVVMRAQGCSAGLIEYPPFPHSLSIDSFFSQA